ncbi:type 4b pilus Flp secretin RcpA [Pseudomonas aeruginosa]|nr:type 4b pilus Flp secretin RcpA [Pseudomonas aeruginosa]
MHRSTGIGVSRWLGGLLGVALALPALALPQGCIELLAQAPRVDVVQGQQRDLRLAVPIERLAIGDPKIADVQLLDRRGFLVTGKEQGSTSLLIWTGCSPEPLRSLVEVEGRGSVDTRGAPAFTVGAVEELPNQMQTDIRFVEVSRSKLKQASTSFVRRGGNLWVLGAPGSLGDIKVNADGSGLGGTFGTGSSGFNLIFGGGKWLSFMNALEGSGFAYTLARPSLVAMSGQSASFLAGGEFPIPVPNGTNDNVTIEYKEFGIRLTLTPTVMNNRRIALKVAPEVSELDYSAGIQSGGVAVPALRVRRTDTSVMLADGESFVISGLTSSNSVSNVDKFPWLGDIPILGAFFRSTKLDKDDRELLMIVTPHLVQPLAADAQLPDLPGEGLRHYDPGFSRLYFLERGEYDGQQNDTGLSD